MNLCRRLRRTLTPGPNCDRCGKPTGKPFLYSTPRTHWRCAPCENEVTDILFQLAAQRTLTEQHLGYTRPIPPVGEDRA